MKLNVMLGVILILSGCGSEKNAVKSAPSSTAADDQKVILSGELKPGEVVWIPVGKASDPVQKITH